jgi:hypothetical protein
MYLNASDSLFAKISVGTNTITVRVTTACEINLPSTTVGIFM